MRKEIISIIDDVIDRKDSFDKGHFYISYSDLTEDEKIEICSYLINDDKYCDYHDAMVDIKDKISLLFLNQDSDAKFDFIHSMYNSITSFYKKSIESMIEDRCMERTDNYYDDIIHLKQPQGVYA